jgi:exonuclease VII small subunit
MNQRATNTPDQVLKFAPKDGRREAGDPTDEAGQALVALLQQAADLSNDNCERAMMLAHKLSLDLRAAEDRIKELQGAVDHYEKRAVRAEQWLQRILKEVEEKLIVPMTATRREQAPFH